MSEEPVLQDPENRRAKREVRWVVWLAVVVIVIAVIVSLTTGRKAPPQTGLIMPGKAPQSGAQTGPTVPQH